jgi:hypothetical protein
MRQLSCHPLGRIINLHSLTSQLEKNGKMNSNILRIFTLLIVAMLPLWSGGATLKMDSSSVIEEHTVYLILHNEGGNIDSLNVNVTMDNVNKIVNNKFSDRSIKLTLTEGVHQIVVTSNNNVAGLDVIFTVDRQLWLYLLYYGNNHYQLYISNTIMGFQ